MMQAASCLQDISGDTWAILPEKMESIISRLDAISAGAAFTPKIEAKKSYEIRGKTAVINVHGPITPKATFFTMIFGGATIDVITDQLHAALGDEGVSDILLDIDSPGGSVTGVNELSSAIYKARAVKPITAYTGGMMASAAYWIGSAAEKVVAGETALVGSIGTILTHVDASKLYSDMGIKVTHITTGPYKAAGNDAEPLSDKARAYYQDLVSGVQEVFTTSVQRNRGLSSKEVSKVTSGKLFVSADAVGLKLIDKVGVAMALSASEPIATEANAPLQNTDKEEEAMNLSDLKSKHPDLVAAIRDEAVDGLVPKSTVDKIQGEMDKVSAENEKLTLINEELVKTVTAAQESVDSLAAGAIVEEVLSESSIPTALHAKVGAQLDYKGHLEDGRLTEAAADAFKAQCLSEVEDWEAKLGVKGANTGLGDDTGETVSADILLGREMARSAGGGRIRSDG